MFRESTIEGLMSRELPPIRYQKRLLYRTDINEVKRLYQMLNYEIFDNILPMPVIEVAPRCRKYWGMCHGSYTYRRRQSYCKIKLMDKWFCVQWLVSTLAHEMCHQYQWDILGEERKEIGLDPIMSHGPSFYVFRDRLADYNIPLKRHHSQRKWFKTQNLFRC